MLCYYFSLNGLLGLLRSNQLPMWRHAALLNTGVDNGSELHARDTPPSKGPSTFNAAKCLLVMHFLNLRIKL